MEDITHQGPSVQLKHGVGASLEVSKTKKYSQGKINKYLVNKNKGVAADGGGQDSNNT